MTEMRIAISVMMFTMLAGCSQKIETRISSSGDAAFVMKAFSSAPADASATAGLARNAVLLSLKDRGVSEDSNASVRLHVTFAALPATLKLLPDAGAKAVPVGSVTHAQPPRKSAKCDPVEYRLGVTFSNIADGAVLYRGSAAEFHCRGHESKLVSILAAAALKDMGAPRGTYAVNRVVKR